MTNKSLLRKYKEKFTKKGIVIQDNQLIALPPIPQNIADLVMQLETLSPPFDIETEVDRLLANIACKSLKANAPLRHIKCIHSYNQRLFLLQYVIMVVQFLSIFLITKFKVFSKELDKYPNITYHTAHDL